MGKVPTVTICLIKRLPRVIRLQYMQYMRAHVCIHVCAFMCVNMSAHSTHVEVRAQPWVSAPAFCFICLLLYLRQYFLDIYH